MQCKIGKKVKEYRKAKGFSQQKLANMIGMSDKVISRWETERGYPCLDVLMPLAKALGVKIEQLL